MGDDGASSSSAAGGWSFDVFLSFRGEDTRKNFVDHLYTALGQKGIFTFKDDEKLRMGDVINPALLKAIEESRTAIIIFSKDFASSTWCLDELVKIIDCMEAKKILKVVPVFYNMEPSEVRKQRGSFEAAFANHERVFGEDKVQRWRAALKKAAHITGCDTRTTANGYESKCIQEIVREIMSDLVHKSPMVYDEDLVGIESRVEEVNSLLSIGSNDVRIIGIWGLGGIGKTTIATAIFNQNSYDQFEGSSYLKNVREVSKNDDVQHLQEKLLSDILLVENVKVRNVREGINVIKNRLHNKRVIVILDDVDHEDQIDNLAGSHHWFGLGSRIIITTRNRHLLCVDATYEVALLNKDEAIQLFSMNAFKMNHPTEGYEELSNEVVHYAGGLPLALKVLGRFLFRRDMTEWRSAVDRLKKIPEGEILEKLRISYNGLEDIEKKLFLDIACFFNGSRRDYVIRILGSSDFYPEIGIGVLIDKCLIVDSSGMLEMHDLIRDMGQYIVCEGHDDEPEKWSRLWCLEDVRGVLEKNTGPSEVEGIVLLHLHGLEKKVIANTEAFIKMNKLRLFMVSNVELSGDLEYLPNKLRWLEWHGYPSKYLPKSFQQLDKLKVIDLRESHKLTRTPDFTGVPNLETLILQCCKSLVEVHPSVGVLKKLSVLNLSYCHSLESLPSIIQLPSLEILNLSHCSKLENFPEIHGNMKQLLELNLNKTGIKYLPSSIEHASNLFEIDLWYCKILRTLPSGICKLKHIKTLSLSGCSRLDKLADNLGEMECLKMFCARDTALKELPSSIEHLTSLDSIDMSNCKSLTSLPETICHLKYLKTLTLSGCSKLDNLPENLGDMECLEELHVDGTAITEPPSSIGHLKNLKILSFRGCKEIAHWYDCICWNSKGLMLPSLSGLGLLKELDLSGCNMFDGALPNDIGNLPSLEELILSGNNFVKLPESINGLSRLEVLVLEGCKNLEALPKLPSNIAQLHADECQSLKSVGDLSTKDKLVSVSFTNCLKLFQNEQSENMTDMLQQCALQALLDCHNGYSIFVPGTEIPQQNLWRSLMSILPHQKLGRSMSIQLPPRWLRKNLMGVGLCFVCEFTAVGGIVVDFTFRIHEDEDEGSSLGTKGLVLSRGVPDKKINSQHLWLTCVSIEELQQECVFCNVGPKESTLEVHVFPYNMVEFKEFGVLPVYKEDTDSDVGWYDEPCQYCMNRAILAPQRADRMWTVQQAQENLYHRQTARVRVYRRAYSSPVSIELNKGLN